MKKIFYILLFILTAINAFAQNKNIEKDSLATKSYLNGDIEYLKFKSSPSFVLPESFTLPNKFDTTASLIRLKTRLSLIYGTLSSENDADVPDNILQPYYSYYLESKKISLLRKVLGLAQLGAVGYLAYKHIKKYGLFHQP